VRSPADGNGYPGAGIYRKVQLVVNEPVHVAQWGTFVTTPQVGSTGATIRIETTVENHTAQAAEPEVETALFDPKGRPVAKLRISFKVPAKGSHAGVATMTIGKPQLWDIETPRPVGLAQCVPESAKSQIPAALDVAGWNYARRYAISRERWPNLPILYTESASAYSTRGYFDDFPMPAKKDDYPLTARISSFGIVDLVGIPKDRYYLYRSHWAPEKKTIHILPHWNWPERMGKNTPVYVYTGGDSAELFLNGQSLGLRTKNPKAEVVRDRYALRWLDVPYQPGELKAIAGVGNGDHHFPAEFDTDHVTLFYGKAMLVVRATEGQGGATRVRATSDELRAAEASLRPRRAR
jgi:hypothetical protein